MVGATDSIAYTLGCIAVRRNLGKEAISLANSRCLILSHMHLANRIRRWIM